MFTTYRPQTDEEFVQASRGFQHLISGLCMHILTPPWAKGFNVHHVSSANG